MNSDGSSPRNLTANWPISNETYPSWSPDGKYIVFTSDISGNSDIWYTPVDHFSPINITNTPEDELTPAIGVPEPEPEFSALVVGDAVDNVTLTDIHTDNRYSINLNNAAISQIDVLDVDLYGVRSEPDVTTVTVSVIGFIWHFGPPC